MEGLITAVDIGLGTISIRSKKTGIVTAVNTDENTIIKKNRFPATLANLVVGDKGEAHYRQIDGDLVATKIAAKSPK